MKIRRECLGILSLSLFFMGAVSTNATAAEKASLVISRPSSDSRVARVDEIIGKLNAEGVPLVLVRPEDNSAEWWIQPAAKLDENGNFVTKAHFGNEKSPMGTRFSFKAVLLRNKADADYFRGREFVTKLPPELTVTPEISVVLGESRPKSTLADVLALPEPGQRVSRVITVKGKVPEGGGFPVVFVRSREPGDLWWVQEPAQLGKAGAFEAVAHVGGDKTPNGTEFEMVVAFVKTKEEADVLKVGASFKELPEGAATSEIVRVVRDRIE